MVGTVIVGILLVGIVGTIVGYQVRETLTFDAGSHDLTLGHLISQDDRNSLSKEEWKATSRMDYEQLQAFLNARFSNSAPQFSSN